MRPFAEYVSRLRDLVDASARAALDATSEEIMSALDGQPSRELRRLVPIELRRADGAFFTGSKLARRVVARFCRSVGEDAVFCDPACGAGDLLIAASERLPVLSDLRATIRVWSRRLRGFDIHEEFVRAARFRLVLAAVRRGARTRRATPDQLAALFSNIQVGDGTAANLGDVSVILMNPPYGMRRALASCKWGAGLVSDAAVFTDAILANAAASTRIIAILPDVLRTGSRYTRWRRAIEQRTIVKHVDVVGTFDRWADVDVFVLHGRKRNHNSMHAPASEWWPSNSSHKLLRDKYDVHVGPVVPHRDPNLGAWRKYLHARAISNCQTFDISSAPSRRFAGRTFRPPFVVIRRTSRPDDRTRAVGTIIVGDAEAAVENHLLVVLPRTGGLEACRALLSVLELNSSTRWLNHRIRCRHLTVGAVADIPWPTNDSNPPSLRD